MNLHTGQSRRQFIKRTLATTGTLGLTKSSGQIEVRDRRQIDPKALSQLRAQLNGGLILPGDPGYDAARHIYYWNPDTDRRPALVARCAHADDVRYAVEFESGGIHIRINVAWKDSAEAQSRMLWAAETRRLLRPSSGERIYANYQSHAGEGAAEAVFGGNLPRLIAAKNKYDPTNFFRRNSNIQPTQA